MPHIHIIDTLPDDRSASTYHNDWFVRFGEALQRRLEELSGLPFALTRNAGGGMGRAEYLDSSILICVLDPSSLHSEPFRAELRRAVIALSGRDSLPLHSRVFVVAVDAIPLHLLPPELMGLPPFDFSGSWPRAINGHAIPRPSYGKEFWIAIDDLAFSVRNTLAVNADPGQPVLFFAEPSPDLAGEGVRLRRELQRHGYMVGTTASMADPARFAEATERELAGAAVSVHFIGGTTGPALPESDETATELQFRAAAERAHNDPQFTQLIWMPPWLENTDERMLKLVEKTREGANRAGHTELIQTSLEDLKSIVFDTLERVVGTPHRELNNVPHEPPASAAIPPDSRSRVYLIHDRRDTAAIEPIVAHFDRCGIEVLLPELEGDHSRLREHHFHLLRICDAAMIYYGQVNEPWVRMKQQDLKKAAGYGRNRELFGAIYVGPNPSPVKERFHAGDLMLIRHFGEFMPDLITPFLEQLWQAAESER